MGREVRSVPPWWQHPKNRDGHYQPMMDRDFMTTRREWEAEAKRWADGTHESLVRNPEWRKDYPTFSDFEPFFGDCRYYRPAWTPEEATAVQMYETVSEGTPVSPVFATRAELANWLVEQGHSRAAAENFAETGYAPSFVMVGGRMAMGVDAHDLLSKPPQAADQSAHPAVERKA